MIRPNAIGLTAILASALLATPAAQPLAEGSNRFPNGFRTDAPHQRAPRHGQRRHAQQPRDVARVPLSSRSDNRATRVYGERGRHVISPGCGPVTRRSYDHRGNLVIRHLSQCYDRFGRAYTLGDEGGHRR